MADKNLSSIVGSGGIFVPTFFSGRQSVGAGASGDIVTLTPPAGKRVRLTSASPAGTSNVEANMSLIIGGVKVVDTKPMALNAFSDNQWSITYGGLSNSQRVGILQEVTGGIDEIIIIRKESATTSFLTDYAYAFGE